MTVLISREICDTPAINSDVKFKEFIVEIADNDKNPRFVRIVSGKAREKK